MKTATVENLQAAATQIFELSKMMRLATQRQKRSGKYELTDYEFLVLDALVQAGTLTVGQLQRKIGVTASQMSRVIRSLEDPERGKLVTTSINPRDKRRFNMNLTREGTKAMKLYRRKCISRTAEMLSDLSSKEREQFFHIFERMQEVLSRKGVPVASSRKEEEL